MFGSAPARTPVSRAEMRIHLILAQLEIKDVDVLPDPARIGRLGDDHETELYMPAQDDLGRGLTMLRGQVHKDGRLSRESLVFCPPRGYQHST